ncbi:hypothetical protein EWM64_g9813 [Hericium alpestre]|uniref:Uncharacterized protein n=1 Tax=Hericium alpestre TaxID=135208 RepID=A0A4Y9ZKQ4_9AGAM|nr:hypothetical protein EWM64_g9813 [Hericium alpestre]
MPFTLSPDEGVRFKDQNGFRMPSSVLLPLFSAVDAVGKEVDWPSIDFITDRNGLRKLMRWIDTGVETKDFRIDLELVGERTVLLNRWEANTQDVASGRTFGFSFERATTSAAPGCEASTAHHRIVKYVAPRHLSMDHMSLTRRCPQDFFGLKTIVRFEVDACLPSAKPRSSRMSAATLDDLTDSLAGLKIEREGKATTSATPSRPTKKKDDTSSAPALKIIRAGSEVPQSSIIELTTRSVIRINELDWTEIYPQLYLSQTPWYYIGIHSRGTFTEVRKSNLTGDGMAAQRRQAKASVQKLGQVLEMIQEAVIAHGVERRLSLVCQQGVLKVYEQSSKESCLPDDVRKRFDPA